MKGNEKGSVFSILILLGVSHMFNDTLQNLVQAVYPMIKESLALNFSQIGIITLVYQMAASIFQPIIGAYTDRKPQPYSLPIGMTFSLIGIFALAFAFKRHLITMSYRRLLSGVGDCKGGFFPLPN